jgi:hypothetical protein
VKILASMDYGYEDKNYFGRLIKLVLHGKFLVLMKNE